MNINQEYGAVLTQIGEIKSTNAIFHGKKITITKFAVGDGNGNYYIPDKNMTKLKNEIWRGDVEAYRVDDDTPNVIKVLCSVPADIGGFTVREAAIFDDENQMIAIGNVPEFVKVALSQGVVQDIAYWLDIEVLSTKVFKFLIDPTVFHVTKKELETHNQSLSAHTDKAQKDLTNVSASSILEKVKVVDGSGSGLDADTVDGKHAVDLQNYNNLTNKPVIPTTLPANGGNADTVDGKHADNFAPAGFGLGTDCINLPSNSDLNDLPEKYKNATGFFMGSSLKNQPVELDSWIYLLQMVHYATYRLQMCFSLNNISEAGNLYTRCYYDNIKKWSDWKKPDASTIAGKEIAYLLNYNNLTNKPTIPTTLPANGGNADTVGGKSVSVLQDYNNLTNKLIINNQVGANAPSYDKVDFDGCNVDIISWYGLGILSPSQNPEKTRSIVINARNGDIKTKGQLYAATDKQVWHEGNDGSGSGLDADTVDGKHVTVLYSNCSAAAPTSYLGDNVQYQVY